MQVWQDIPEFLSNKLESIQKRVLRIIYPCHSYLGCVYMIPARLSFRYEFTPVPSCGSVFIPLHDTSTKSHTRASHTGASSPRLLYRSEIFIPVRKLIPMSCKRGSAVRSSMKSLPLESVTGSARAFFDIQSNMASPGRHNHV